MPLACYNIEKIKLIIIIISNSIKKRVLFKQLINHHHHHIINIMNFLKYNSLTYIIFLHNYFFVVVVFITVNCLVK